MGSRHAEHIRLGGTSAVLLFVVVLLSFVMESQLTQYVQAELDYRQPLFLLYVAHSSFAFALPLHLAYLVITTGNSWRTYFSSISYALRMQLTRSGKTTKTVDMSAPFPWLKLSILVLGLTCGVTVPALLWFVSVTLASITDVTALWNSNAFWAYIIYTKIRHLPLEPRKLYAVTLATLGVLVVVYGGGHAEPPGGKAGQDVEVDHSEPQAPLVGILMTLVASILYGLYQVLYKTHVALPDDPELDASHSRVVSSTGLLPAEEADEEPALDEILDEVMFPPPFGLYSNTISTLIGVATLALLWVPLLFFDWVGVEPLRYPRDLKTFLCVCGIGVSGMSFNVGNMVLLGVWGPVVTSVGNLLTIVLVLITDLLFGRAAESLTMWSLLGSGMIVIAFWLLAWDTFKGS